MSYACSDLGSEDTNLEDSEKQGRQRSRYSQNQTDRTGTYVDTQFSMSSELGDWILGQSRLWEKTQIDKADEYAQPRMCAHNVSKVL